MSESHWNLFQFVWPSRFGWLFGFEYFVQFVGATNNYSTNYWSTGMLLLFLNANGFHFGYLCTSTTIPWPCINWQVSYWTEQYSTQLYSLFASHVTSRKLSCTSRSRFNGRLTNLDTAIIHRADSELGLSSYHFFYLRYVTNTISW